MQSQVNYKSASHDGTVLSNQLGESHRWHKDHFGSMLPDINGYSFRSSKGNDSSHILCAFEIAKVFWYSIRPSVHGHGLKLATM